MSSNADAFHRQVSANQQLLRAIDALGRWHGRLVDPADAFDAQMVANLCEALSMLSVHMASGSLPHEVSAKVARPGVNLLQDYYQWQVEVDAFVAAGLDQVLLSAVPRYVEWLGGDLVLVDDGLSEIRRLIWLARATRRLRSLTDEDLALEVALSIIDEGTLSGAEALRRHVVAEIRAFKHPATRALADHLADMSRQAWYQWLGRRGITRKMRRQSG